MLFGWVFECFGGFGLLCWFWGLVLGFCVLSGFPGFECFRVWSCAMDFGVPLSCFVAGGACWRLAAFRGCGLGCLFRGLCLLECFVGDGVCL